MLKFALGGSTPNFSVYQVRFGRVEATLHALVESPCGPVSVSSVWLHPYNSLKTLSNCTCLHRSHSACERPWQHGTKIKQIKLWSIFTSHSNSHFCPEWEKLKLGVKLGCWGNNMLIESACVTWYFLSFSTKSILGMKFTRSLLCGWLETGQTGVLVAGFQSLILLKSNMLFPEWNDNSVDVHPKKHILLSFLFGCQRNSFHHRDLTWSLLHC